MVDETVSVVGYYTESTKTALSWGEIFIVFDLPDTVVDLIGNLGGHLVTPGTPCWVQEL